MDKFEEFIIKKYPNRSPKVLLQKFQDTDGTWFYGVKEVQDQSQAWQEQQAEIDRLSSVLDERTKEWLEAIELGKYFENVAKPLKAELDEKDKRIDELSNLLDRSEINHKHLLTKYQSTKLMEMESSKRLSVIETLIESWRDLKIKGIAPEHRAYEDALNKCADELENALRGDNA